MQITGQGHTDQWEPLEATSLHDAERVRLGVLDGDWLPSRYLVTARQRDGGLSVEMECTFDGRRVRVPSLWLTGPVTARALAALKLPDLIEEGAWALGTAPDAAGLARRRPVARPAQLGDETLEEVAAAYCWGAATRGRGTKVVCEVWGLPTRTANNWIARAAQAFPLVADLRRDKS